MMTSSPSKVTNRRRATSPSSPMLSDPCPPSSWGTVDLPPRARSSSLTRVRENLRKKTANIQVKVGRELVRKGEECLSPSTRPGLVFHVPHMPEGHSPESIVQCLQDTVSRLSSNPGTSTQISSSWSTSSKSDEMPDLLDFGECLEFPAIQPSQYPSLLHKKSITTVAFSCDQVTQKAPVNFEPQRLSTSTIPGILIDLDEQIPTTTVPVSLSLTNSPSPVRTPISNVEWLIQCFEGQSNLSEAANTTATRPSARYMIHGAGATLSRKDGSSTITKSETSSQYVAYKPIVSRKPIPQPETYTATNARNVSAAPTYLGVGLRPALAVAHPPILTITPAPPSTAISSTEVVERKNAATKLLTSASAKRNLSRKRNDRDLRTSSLHRSTDSSSAQHAPSKGQNLQIPTNSVADKISRFEKPLPQLPTNTASTTARSTKRLCIYGPPPLNADAQSAQTKKEFEGIKLDTKDPNDRKPYGEFQPYRPTLTVDYTTQSSPKLPPIMRSGEGSTLREIRHELFLDSPQNDTAVASIIPLSPHEFPEGKDKENEDVHNKGIWSPSQHLRSKPELPYIPYSRSIVRKGTLEQLGGRVVKIRKHFEQDEPMDKQANMPPSSNRELAKHTTRSHGNSRTKTAMTDDRYTKPSPQSAHTHTQTSPPPNSYRSNTTNTNTNTKPLPLYALLHPSHAAHITNNPNEFRSQLSQSTRQRLQAAADEADLAETWARAVETGRDSELLRKLDFAWEWKRFSDQEWNERQRGERPRKR